MKPVSAVRFGVWLVFLVVLGTACLPPIWNIDLFWHIAAGDWMRLHSTIPNTDIFSATDPERTWIPFQWLFEVGVSLLAEKGGLLSIRLGGWLLLLLSAGIGIAHWRRLLSNPWAPLMLCALLFVLFGDRIRFRPHLFNLFFILTTLPLLIVPHRMPQNQRLLYIAGTMPLWANIHAGGAMIFIVLLFTLPAGAFLERVHAHFFTSAKKQDAMSSLRKDSIAFGFAAVLALLMPNFASGFLHSLTMLGASEGLITEWRPAASWIVLGIQHSSPALLLVGILPWVTLVGSLMCLPRVLREARKYEQPVLTFQQWLLCFGIGLITVRYGRFAWLVILPATLATLAGIRLPWEKQFSTRIVPLLAVLCVGCFLHYQVGTVGGGPNGFFTRIQSDIDSRRFPVASACFLQQTPVPNRAFTLPNWGGYLLWKTQNQVRVLADGRGNYTAEEARAIQQVYEHRWKPEEWKKTRAAFNQFDELDMIVIQEPAIPKGKSLKGWIRIFPPNEQWVKEFGLPEPVAMPRKGAIYLREGETKRLEAARTIWADMASRGGKRPDEWMELLVGEGFCDEPIAQESPSRDG